ncbi:MAG: hybrid sensor histidine kinase/response regulator [Cyanobacteriota bacterium]|nr:hybrid sensor histidine kinase/response regulator [Cyanobacteriota bacterium]
MKTVLQPKADILIVDDTPDNLRLLSAMLQNQGYKVRKAMNGLRALQVVQTVAPDLILLDIFMPDLDGYEVCRHLKESPATRDIPVLFVSASDESLDKVLAFEVGGLDYITKPFDVREVLARVETHLKLRQLQLQLQLQNEQLSQEVRDRVAAEDALQCLNRELEDRVRSRTAELETANAQLRALEVDLRASLDKEQELNQQKDEFLKNISHELRTPLNGILGNLRLVLDELCDDREEELEMLQEADVSAVRLLGMVNNILDLANLTMKQVQASEQVVEVGGLLDKAIAPLQPQIQQKQLHLLRHDRDGSLSVRADPRHLERVFSHLLDNAVKFTPQGSITITTSMKPNSDNPQAEIAIEDTGIGFDPQLQSQLGQAFVMMDGTRTRKHGGAGLGLAIAKELMQLMGGTISLVSAGPGCGTRALLSLPLKTCEEAENREQTVTGEHQGRESHSAP